MLWQTISLYHGVAWAAGGRRESGIIEVNLHIFWNAVLLTMVSYRIFWWGWKKFVGHCHGIMHEYETTNFQVLRMRLYQFSRFLRGGGIPGPLTLCMKPC